MARSCSVKTMARSWSATGCMGGGAAGYGCPRPVAKAGGPFLPSPMLVDLGRKAASDLKLGEEKREGVVEAISTWSDKAPLLWRPYQTGTFSSLLTRVWSAQWQPKRVPSRRATVQVCVRCGDQRDSPAACARSRCCSRRYCRCSLRHGSLVLRPRYHSHRALRADRGCCCLGVVRCWCLTAPGWGWTW